MKLAFFQRFADASHVAPWDSEETIRSELFSIERLEQHARSLAAAQPIADRTITVRPLDARLKENAKILLEAHRAIAAAVASGGAITPSAEWLLDNIHIVEEQVREIFVDLPPTYYRQLPKLAAGPFAGSPASSASRGHSSRIRIAVSTRRRAAFPEGIPERTAVDDR